MTSETKLPEFSKHSTVDIQQQQLRKQRKAYGGKATGKANTDPAVLSSNYTAPDRKSNLRLNKLQTSVKQYMAENFIHVLDVIPSSSSRFIRIDKMVTSSKWKSRWNFHLADKVQNKIISCTLVTICSFSKQDGPAARILNRDVTKQPRKWKT